MKQRAVEWLVEYIQNENKNGHEFHPKYNEEIVNQAKEMEKQQIIEAFYDGCFDTNSWRAEQYYNQTFKEIEKS